MADLRSRILRGSAWITAAKLVTNLLSLASTFVLARLLVPADFGLVALGTTLLAIVSAVTELPLSEALISHAAPTRAHFDTVWTLSLGRALLLAGILAAAAYPVAIEYGDRRLCGVLLVLACGVVLSGLENPRAIMLTRDLVFWQQFMLQVTQRMIALIVAVAVAVTFRSYWALLVGTLAGQLAAVVVSYTVLPYRPRPGVTHARELFGFSLWLTLCQVVNTLNWRLDQLLIGTWLGRAPLGVYTVGDNLAATPTREATAPLVGTLYPAFSAVRSDPARLASAYERAQTTVVFVAVPVGVGLATVADPLVRACLGDRWAGAVPVVEVLAPVFALQSLGNLAQPLAMAVGETASLFRRDLVGLQVRAPLILGALVVDGFSGILHARVLTGLFGLLLNLRVVERLAGLSIGRQLRPHARTLVATAAMVAAVFSVRAAMPTTSGAVALLAATVPSGMIAYGCAAFGSWVACGRPDGAEAELLRLVTRRLPSPLRLART